MNIEMKKYLKMAVVIGGISLVTSCKKFVDYSPQSAYIVSALTYLQSQLITRPWRLVFTHHCNG